MTRPKLEVADIFRVHGPAWRQANAGHVAGCTKCGHHHIAYNSCKNRHCPKSQGPAARDWMEARAEDLLPVEYFRVVFTLPAVPLGDASITCRSVDRANRLLEHEGRVWLVVQSICRNSHDHRR